MRVLVLGAAGMLGHKLVQRLGTEFAIAGTIRATNPDSRLGTILRGAKLYAGVSAGALGSIENAVQDWGAEAIINCIGIVKQLDAAKETIPSLTVNALLPHQVHDIATRHGARLVHFSTDCVFSGEKGNYLETDVTDARDLYGRTKVLGEVAGAGALTLRTSIIGRELGGHVGLVDWFLSNRAKRVKGFARALYSGLTTNAMADTISWLLTNEPSLDGLWHLSADPISKFELLNLVNRVYQLGVVIDRDEEFFCDRRLDSSRFRTITGWRPPSWEEMIVAMRRDDTPYPALG